MSTSLSSSNHGHHRSRAATAHLRSPAPLGRGRLRLRRSYLHHYPQSDTPCAHAAAVEGDNVSAARQERAGEGRPAEGAGDAERGYPARDCAGMYVDAQRGVYETGKGVSRTETAQQCFDRRTEIEKGNHKDSIHEPRQEAELLKEEGNRLFKQKQYVKAGALYKEAIDKDPSNPVLHSNIAQVLIHLKQLELAQFHAEACCQLDPEWAKGWYRLGEDVWLIGLWVCGWMTTLAERVALFQRFGLIYYFY
ncbi:hypothetical protein BC938DRAFT_483922, partial [Jimgerdemannia flammicorona]